MNKVEFNDKMELTVNGDVVDLEMLYCAMMRRTASNELFGPGTWNHRSYAFGVLESVFESAIERLEHERKISPFQPGKPGFRG